ncbi:MAG: hypothetical protein KC609_21290 [Myxococcales bacterium]|nr:hypothetical protein [Myxococcales bacterium]
MAINSIDAVDYQQPLVDRCTFPLFQDTTEVNAWTLHDGHKDDILIYDKNGVLYVALPNGGAVNTNLSTPEGYENLKSRVLEAHNQP